METKIVAWKRWKDAWDALTKAHPNLTEAEYAALCLSEASAREQYRRACGGISWQEAHRPIHPNRVE